MTDAPKSLVAAAALLDDGFARDVSIGLDPTGTITTIGGVASDGAERIEGLVIPGLPDLHSHAFQRAMAGLAERAGPEGDNFWAWREVMYRFLQALTPEDVEAIAAQLYVEC